MTTASQLDVAEQIEQAMTALMRGPRVRRMHERLRARSGLDLDRPAYIALASLGDQGPMRISDLADACDVDTSTMSRLVERLLARELVERQASSDQRAVVLRLSAKGKRTRRRLRSVGREALQQLLSAWERDDQERFATLLTRFVADVERMLQETEP